MKYLFFLLFLMIGFGVKGQDYFSNSGTLDTLTNSDTSTYTWTKVLNKHGVIEYHVAVDSLSGDPAGTIYYEYSLDPSGEEWYTVSTDTIANAPETSAQHKVTNFAGRRARIKVISTGTQTCEVNPAITFKEY
jgi:hypothetical protein